MKSNNVNYQGEGEDYRGYFQNIEEQKMIAGFSYQEVLDKLTSLYDELYAKEGKASKEKIDNLNAKIHILEKVFDISENRDKYKNEEENCWV